MMKIETNTRKNKRNQRNNGRNKHEEKQRPSSQEHWSGVFGARRMILTQAALSLHSTKQHPPSFGFGVFSAQQHRAPGTGKAHRQRSFFKREGLCFPLRTKYVRSAAGMCGRVVRQSN